MATTSWVDFTAEVREIPNRTDNTGTGVDDLPLREDALINAVLTEGVVTPAGAFTPSKGSGDFDVDIGSGTSSADIFVVTSDVTGQQPYIVTLEQTTATVTLDAADADPRIDEIYLVVRDDGVDSNADGHRLPRLGYRKGDSATSDPAAPGPDAGWENYALLASISVAGGATSITASDITDERVDSQFVQRVFDESVRQTAASVFGSVLDSRYAELSGDTFSGAVDMGSNKITSLANPTTGTDALNRQTGDSRYADDPHGNAQHSTNFSAQGHGHGDHDGTVPRSDFDTYTGDGSDNRTVSVGFTPSYVTISADAVSNGSGDVVGGYTLSTERGIIVHEGGTVSANDTALKIVSGGFEVDASGPGPNANSVVYNYAAFA